MRSEADSESNLSTRKPKLPAPNKITTKANSHPHWADFPWPAVHFVVVYALYSYAILALGALDAINRVSLLLALAIAVAGGIAASHALRRLGTRSEQAASRSWRQPMIPLLILLCLASLHSSLLPVFKEDDLIYHLWVPRRMAASGGLVTDFGTLGAHFPLLFEFPLTFAETFKLNPLLINTLLLPLLAYLIYGLLVLVGKQRPVDGLMATLSMLAAPVVFDLSHAAYVELFFAIVLLTAVTLYAQASNSSAPWANLPAYVIAAVAVGTKYYGLPVLAALFIADLTAKRSRQVAIIQLSLAMVIASPFYIKTWALLGNPVFPYLRWLFDSSAVSEARLQLSEQLTHALAGGDNLGVRITRLAGVFGLSSIAKSSTAAPMGGQLTIAYFLAALAGLNRRPWARVIAACCGVFLLLWLVTAPLPRYLFAFALVAVLLGVMAVQAKPRWRLMILLVAIIGILQGARNTWLQAHDEGIVDVLTGQRRPREFLARRYPAAMALADAANLQLDAAKSKIFLVGLFGRAYYFNAPTYACVFFDTEPLLSAFAPEAANQAEFGRFIAAENLTHMAINWQFVQNFHRDDGLLDFAALKRWLSAHGRTIWASGPYELIELLPPGMGALP